MKTDLRNALGRLITDARNSGDAQEIRAELFDRYMGEPYGDEQPNRSKFISTDVADAVESFLPDTLEPFLGSDRVVQFAPQGPEDEDGAEQETDVCQHVFWRLNDGFTNVYTAQKEASIQQNSYFKQGWVEKERVLIEEYDDLTPDEFYNLMQQWSDDAEFLSLEGLNELGMPVMDEMGQFMPIQCKVRIVQVEKKYEICVIPQEEFFHTPGWPKVALEGIPCCGHRRQMEKGELRRMGFSEESIAKGYEYDDEEQKAARHATSDHQTETDVEAADDSTRQVMVYEAYCRADINEDGRAELVKVWSVGDGTEILQWETGEDAIEEVGDIPFEAYTPNPVPHRHVGRSHAEQVDDIAHTQTILGRHTLDSIYATNYPRPIVSENGITENTLADIANPEHGAPIRVQTQEGIRYDRPPTVIDATLPLMQRFDDIREARTGSTRYNQGLDSESLNQTATGIGKIMDASMKRRQLVARVFANSLRGVFLRMHRDLRNGPMKELTIKLRNQWVKVNPRNWKERTDMTINVGMGSGDRDIRRAGLLMMGTTLEKMAMDPEIRGSGLVGYPQFREVAEDVMRTFGIDEIDKYMPPPEMAQPQQPDPMAEQMKRMQMQLVQTQLENAQLDRQAKISDMRRRDAEVGIRQQAEERQRLAADAKILQDARRLDLDRQEAVMDDDFKRDKLEVDAITGFHRQDAKRVDSTPPITYPGVLNG